MQRHFSTVSRKRNGGYVLLLSVLIAGIVLAIALGMLSILEKSLILSSTGEESQRAFYAADSGSECALYWDFKYDLIGSAFATSSDSNPPGAGEDVLCNSQDIKDSSQTNHTLVALLGDGSATTTFNLAFTNGTCATVSVMKSQEGLRTVITASGYNTCDPAYPRRLERAIRVFY